MIVTLATRPVFYRILKVTYYNNFIYSIIIVVAPHYQKNGPIKHVQRKFTTAMCHNVY